MVTSVNHLSPSCSILVKYTLGSKCYVIFCRSKSCVYRVYHKITSHFNTFRPRQNGRHFAADIFKCIFLNENVWISIKISLKFVHRGPINNIAALVQIMAWRRPGDKPLSEPMMIILLTHICVTWPQWVNTFLTLTGGPRCIIITA